MTPAINISPQQTDPLGWFTRPIIPLIFATMVLLYGLASAVLTWPLMREPWLDILALALDCGACWLVGRWTRPLRGMFSWRQAVVPLVLAVAAVILASLSGRESSVLVQNWWAPVGAGLVIGTLAPYSSVRQLVVYSGALTVATSVGSWVAFVRESSPWPALSTVTIAASAVAVAGVASIIFSFVIVSKTQSLLSGEGAGAPLVEVSSSDAARQVERRTLARLGTRVAPFLQEVADAGVVTDADRALAGQLARRLRSDLVSLANRSWLDSLALYGAMYVVDPDRLADRMNTVQRAALRGLLLAVMKNPTTHNGSLFIELRGQEDGSTAVAISIDVDLPEGRRSMMLAPYYLTLQTDVRGLEWDPSRELLKFQFPAQHN